MLSKPKAASSGSNSVSTSTRRSSKSRMALPYSARLSLRSAGRPGFGRAVRSSSVSSQDAVVSYAAGAGRALPGGGIVPVLNLRTTLSHAAGLSWTLAGSRRVSDSPAVCNWSLWQETQYCLRTALASGAEALAGNARGAPNSASPARKLKRIFCTAKSNHRNHFAPIQIAGFGAIRW